MRRFYEYLDKPRTCNSESNAKHSQYNHNTPHGSGNLANVFQLIRVWFYDFSAALKIPWRLSNPPNCPPEHPQGFNWPSVLPVKKIVITSGWRTCFAGGCEDIANADEAIVINTKIQVNNRILLPVHSCLLDHITSFCKIHDREFAIFVPPWHLHK